ncbi:nucleoside deaminase [Mariprofundus erugo]|uniref:Nucleoside deaminase n=1 Tax=Mariprofundus erugo TaxID=2528639 RepID=A0A5R9GZP4_9PROT|nr:nucleoside deaminase [Mariprofundus erugo]TLS68284.1 nucleoside deaminase [Mariprofundus erugo]
MSTSTDIRLYWPEWLPGWLSAHNGCYADRDQRMQLAIELARLNIESSTGGPFGALIFDIDRHTIIAAGINRVVPCQASIAHAEIMAITAAQQQLGSFSLAAPGVPRCELVTSCQPCAMCFGAIPWSGIRHLACGARDTDALAIGFDEGPRHPQWITELEKRGISVETDICRPQAAAVLQQYANSHGPIYNAGESGT